MVDIELLQQIVEECSIALNEDGVTEVETRRYTFIRDTAKNILKESIRFETTVLAICPAEIWDDMRNPATIGWSGARELTLQIPIGRHKDGWDRNVRQAVMEDPGEENWDFIHTPEDVMEEILKIFLLADDKGGAPFNSMTPLGFGLSHQPAAFEQEAYVYVQITEVA